jgi:putative aldouronate transport system permease protein
MNRYACSLNGRNGWRQNFWRHLYRDRFFVLMILPVVVYFLLFSYYPMYGVLIAFKDYMPNKGILGSDWVGLKYFEQFFNGVYFWRLLRNTMLISIYSLLWGFPVPIIFALILNEFKDGLFKRLIQTFSYMPHFISLVVTCGMLINFLSPTNGIINAFIRRLGGKPVNFLGFPQYFRTVYVASGIWQEFGWNSIIFIAALSGVDPQMYEAARIDGAGRFKQMLYITIPSIMNTMTILLILSIGNIMSVGFEKIILLYSSATYDTADVISTYVYRMGLQSLQYSYSSAVGLFNSVVNVTLLVVSNAVAKKLTENGIW